MGTSPFARPWIRAPLSSLQPAVRAFFPPVLDRAGQGGHAAGPRRQGRRRPRTRIGGADGRASTGRAKGMPTEPPLDCAFRATLAFHSGLTLPARIDPRRSADQDSSPRRDRETPMKVVMLQGPVGGFFRYLKRALVQRGFQVVRVNFNGGDALFSDRRRRRALPRRPGRLGRLVRAHPPHGAAERDRPVRRRAADPPRGAAGRAAPSASRSGASRKATCARTTSPSSATATTPTRRCRAIPRITTACRRSRGRPRSARSSCAWRPRPSATSWPFGSAEALYPGYQHHRDRPIMSEIRYWTRSAYRKAMHARPRPGRGEAPDRVPPRRLLPRRAAGARRSPAPPARPRLDVEAVHRRGAAILRPLGRPDRSPRLQGPSSRPRPHPHAEAGVARGGPARPVPARDRAPVGGARPAGAGVPRPHHHQQHLRRDRHRGGRADARARRHLLPGAGPRHERRRSARDGLVLDEPAEAGPGARRALRRPCAGRGAAAGLLLRSDDLGAALRPRRPAGPVGDARARAPAAAAGHRAVDPALDRAGAPSRPWRVRPGGLPSFRCFPVPGSTPPSRARPTPAPARSQSSGRTAARSASRRERSAATVRARKSASDP